MKAGETYVDADPDRLVATMGTNYFGSVWSLQAFLPGLGSGSHLVNVVSVAGTVASGPYSATKHAQLAFSRSVAVELAPRGISVHTVNPGYVETPGFPHRHRFGLLLRWIVADPSFVADRIVQAIERDHREIFVPRWYRPFAVLQALFPGFMARAQGRRRSRGR